MNKEKMQDIKERLDLFPSNMNEPAQKAYCELFDYINHLEQQCKKQKKVIDKIESLIKSKDNGTCIHNNERRGAYTFVLDFDEAREFIWELLQILEDKGK